LFNGWEWLMPLVVERNSTVFDYLKDTVFVIDEPVGVETYVADVYQTLAQRFGETDNADDIGLSPEELYLTPDQLRQELDATQRRVEDWAARLRKQIRPFPWTPKRPRFNSAA
jgi:transcription-repair coupling factor (superfamily II helicase)